MENLTTGVGSVLKRTAFARGAEEWDTSSRRVTARLMGHQGGENQVLQGAEVGVVVLLAEVVMGDMEMEIRRSRVMQKCWLVR